MVISSKLTKIYQKIFLPIFLLNVLLIVIFIAFDMGDYSIFIGLGYVSLMAYIINRNLKVIKYDEKETLKIEYVDKSVLEVNLKDVESIKRYFFNYYKIKYKKDGNSYKVKFLPRFTDVYFFYSAPDVVKLIRSKIERLKD